MFVINHIEGIMPTIIKKKEIFHIRCRDIKKMINSRYN